MSIYHLCVELYVLSVELHLLYLLLLLLCVNMDLVLNLSWRLDIGYYLCCEVRYA